MVRVFGGWVWCWEVGDRYGGESVGRGWVVIVGRW